MRQDLTVAHKGQLLGYRFAEVAFESLPFEEWRADADHGPTA